ncbi:MAG: enoyl-CoA hydratase/isomerase family protein [Candidatus Abyssobacteria bacterium SURF_5]|uniref:Enoyl-CoA hydratase/isomerase family protein n=1 Tax=Abyssobacteria bacterium (strain SURF_5) TaxID=2093360 RepID=A0A3A4NG63_ABYX5|nr:MAG: enoyl-CoA hydratase/isomerase family protein [Candidatus Abyssubacteria bacterium SURF_5]
MTPNFEFLNVTVQDGVATIILNRVEKMNSLCMKLRDEIEQCLDLLEADQNVRSAILTGGEDVFCAGFDINEVIETELESFSHRILEYHEKIYGFPKPIVAAVSGFALAGGFDLALCGDIIIASDTAVFGHPEIRFGVNPLLTPLWRKVGPSKAAELVMTGEMLNAEKAVLIGLAVKAVPPDRLLAEASEFARKLAKIEPRALAAVKRASMVVPKLDLRSSLEYEFGLTAEIMRNSELKSRIETYARKAGLIS